MAVCRRFRNLFRRSKIDHDIEAELQTHIAMRMEANVAAGMSGDQARRDALVRFGNLTTTKERVTASDTTLSFAGLGRDVRLAMRQLRRSPGFALTAVLTLAVAIGADAVVFSVLNALVLRPLNLPGANDLYSVETDFQSLNSYPDYRDLRDRNRIFDGIAAYNLAPASLNTGISPEPIWVYEASGNYFDVLGVKPYFGRFFGNRDENGPDSSPYVVLSYAYWQSRFHGDAAIVGRAVEVNRHNFTVLGIAPPKFRGTEMFFSPALWAPLVDEAEIEGANILDDRRSRNLFLVARLRQGVSKATIDTDLNRVATYLKTTYTKDDDGISLSLSKPGFLGNLLGRPVRAFISGLMLLAGLILLAACANLGSLFRARAADRSREIAMRMALGSTRRRILRQLLTESVLVSLAGGAAGMAGGVVLLGFLSVWQPLPRIPINVPVTPDARTYAAALTLALASGLLCGLAPLRQIFRTAPWEVVKTGMKTTAGGGRLPARDVLLVIQVTACAVLMTSSLVAVRGLARSLHSNFGFTPRNAVLVSSDLNMAGYSANRTPGMERRMLDAVAALPGVASAGLIDQVPLGLGWNDSYVFSSEASDFRQSNSVAEATGYNISPGYFQAAGTMLMAGRDFTWHDDKSAPEVAVVNRELARRLFGSVSQAIGGHFRLDAKTRLRVVGVVEDGKYKTLTEDPKPAFFQPLLQSPSSAIWIVARSGGNQQQIARAMRETLRSLDSGLPLTVATWPEELDSALFAARAATLSLGVLGMLGAMLALTGIFAMASYSVGKRLKEMGIRVALGADHGQVLRAALGRSVGLLAVGSLAGILFGMAAARLLSYIVYQATPYDPVVLGGTVLVMLAVGLLATWAPAQRALGVDPSELMREE